MKRNVKPAMNNLLIFPGGGSIWSAPEMDLWWGIWTAFRPGEGGFEQNFFKTLNARGVAGRVLASIWLVQNQTQSKQRIPKSIDPESEHNIILARRRIVYK